MDNLEYLENIKKADEKHHNDNDIGIEEIVVDVYYEEYRKIKALEIIAEQIINLDNTLACVITTLENIDTTLNRR